MDYIERNVRFVTDYCNDFIPEIVPVKPEGTYMIWLDCKNNDRYERIEGFL